MAKRTPLDKLEDSISKILEEYGEQITENLDEVTIKVGKAGVTALRNESKETFGGTGKYAKGWKSETQTTRLGTSVVIYNTTPGLPHLLEHGHAKRNGGRVAGREHIAPVEGKIIKEYETEVAESI